MLDQEKMRLAVKNDLLPLTANSEMLESEILAEIVSVIESKEREIEQLSNSIRSDADALRMSEDIPQAVGAYCLILQSKEGKQKQVTLLRGHIKLLRAIIPWQYRIRIRLARIMRLFYGTEGG